MSKRSRAESSSAASDSSSSVWDPTSMLLVGVPQGALLVSHSAALDADPSQATRMLAELAQQEAAAQAEAVRGRQRFLYEKYNATAALHGLLQRLPSELEAVAIDDVLEAVSAGRAQGIEIDPIERLAEWGITLSAEGLARVHAAHSHNAAHQSESPRNNNGSSSSSSVGSKSMQVDDAEGFNVDASDAAQHSSSDVIFAVKDGEKLYHGRPVRGATSGALYLSAEWETGAPPPPKRSGWRYLVGEGSDGLPKVEHGVAGSSVGGSGGGSSSLDPVLVAQAREALKRPAFPDRRQPMQRTGAGSTEQRGLALAADFDEASAVQARHDDAANAAVLAQLAALGR